MKSVFRLFIVTLSFILPMSMFSNPLILGIEGRDAFSGLPNYSGPQIDFGPKLSDDQLKHEPVYLDLAHSALLASPSQPIKVYMTLRGYLLSSCHHLRVDVTPADSQNSVKLEVYSLVDQQNTCRASLKPFTTTVSLGTFAKGYYTLTVNDERLGMFYIGDGPRLINAS